MSSPILFSEEYHQNVLRQYGYSSFDLRRFDFNLARQDSHLLNARYFCHFNADKYAKIPQQRRVVTTGFGMSGLPHLATASHILKMIELQKMGERCQIVLGDLDAYNGKTRSFGQVTELAAKYRQFCLNLGFDDDAGILRYQVGYQPALEAMYLLGRYVTYEELRDAEEDNHLYYATKGIVDPTMTFRRALSLCLMVADFIDAGQRFDGVMVMLGLDEHRYVRFAQQTFSQIDDAIPLRSNFLFSASYTRMVRGFGGYPKFSKSFPGSAIDVTTPPENVYRMLTSEPAAPEESTTYQLMCQIPFFGYQKLLDLAEHCREGGECWRSEVSKFADYVINVLEQWPDREKISADSV
ncbi:hypothetical protein [Rhizobium rhizogenes]|uniref:hypothetical protein n=1 Tax=Rhizobium rhizogenes TaxID=359 RepID=UPI0015716570|nr:hypothetical protein [Rhizobium rhizogenes]NTH23014.1 hypothetical protein [Rhizobium rhizogenes]NTH36044.1 hypothetical protein [Rhizobium rhizogenes]